MREFDGKFNKIYINARFLTQSITGVQRYACEVVKALDQLIDSEAINPKQYQFELLAPPQELLHDLGLKHIRLRKVGTLSGHAWEQFDLPRYARQGRLVNLCNTGPLLKRQQVVTIHDAGVFGVPEAYSRAFRTWYKVLFRGLGRRTDKIVTVSNFSKSELTKFAGIPANKIEVIYEGREHVFNNPPDYSIIKNHNLTDSPFILAVSSMSPHKNFGAVVKAIELLGDEEYQFVIAGGTNPKVFRSSANVLPDSVKLLGYVSDRELRALYEKAACFIYPSLYEGFGLPPLEAMACGCPVIVSGAASLPEVCGEAVLYCDPRNPADIADKIKLIMNDCAMRDGLRLKGLERSGKFSWEACVRQLLAIIGAIGGE